MKKVTKENALQSIKSIPSDESLAKISALLTIQHDNRGIRTKYAAVKDVLALLGRGTVISAALLAPKSASLLLPLVKESPDWNEWKRFNISYLQRTLRRLDRQKDVETAEESGRQIIRLTKNGKRKVLKYSLNSLFVEKPKQWDGKWRLVVYDVPIYNKKVGDILRQTLRSLGFYAIQDSVYIFPYSCFDHIEFLREYYGLGDHVQYILVEKIERDSAFKSYFGLS